jgi:ATP-dependent DNA helicase
MIDRSSSESPQSPTTAPSSPPDIWLPDAAGIDPMFEDGAKQLKEEEEMARVQNERDENKRRKALAAKRNKTGEESAEERNRKAKQLDSLLAKSAVRPAE